MPIPAPRPASPAWAATPITAVNSPRGNGDYSIEDPPRYPFAFSDNAFLEPSIASSSRPSRPSTRRPCSSRAQRAEFCSACHKVHLPRALNRYRWLRGQNHYDSFLLSGVSGHRVDSFYYPPRPARPAPTATCRRRLGRPGGRDLGEGCALRTRSHVRRREHGGAPHARAAGHEHERRFEILEASRAGGHLRAQGGRQHRGTAARAPASGAARAAAGARYLLEVVVRTTGLGHELTQGTSDSNELWLDLTVRAGDAPRSAAPGRSTPRGRRSLGLLPQRLPAGQGRQPHRAAQRPGHLRRPLQSPDSPGAAAVIHYALTLPAGCRRARSE